MYEFIAKFDGSRKDRSISEHFVSVLIKAFFPEDSEAKMLDLKFGHPLKIRDVTISAWPMDKE